MIKFSNWTIKAVGPVLCRQHDNKTHTVEVTGDIPEGWDWKLLLEHDSMPNIILMDKDETGLHVVLKQEDVPFAGTYKVQLLAVNGEMKKHTNQIFTDVHSSIPEDENSVWPELPGEFTQFEQRVEQLVGQAEESASASASASDSARENAEQAQVSATAAAQSSNEAKVAAEIVIKAAEELDTLSNYQPKKLEKPLEPNAFGDSTTVEGALSYILSKAGRLPSVNYWFSHGNNDLIELLSKYEVGMVRQGGPNMKAPNLVMRSGITYGRVEYIILDGDGQMWSGSHSLSDMSTRPSATLIMKNMVIVANLTNENGVYTLDKTFEEIKDLLNSGNEVIIRYDGGNLLHFYLSFSNENFLRFQWRGFSGVTDSFGNNYYGKNEAIEINILDDNSIEWINVDDPYMTVSDKSAIELRIIANMPLSFPDLILEEETDTLLPFDSTHYDMLQELLGGQPFRSIKFILSIPKSENTAVNPVDIRAYVGAETENRAFSLHLDNISNGALLVGDFYGMNGYASGRIGDQAWSTPELDEVDAIPTFLLKSTDETFKFPPGTTMRFIIQGIALPLFG